MLDPFCGVGTVVALANAMGLDSTGVEVSAKRVRKAKVPLHLFSLGTVRLISLTPRCGDGGSDWTYERSWRAWM